MAVPNNFFEEQRVYGPNDGQSSSIGTQLIPFYYQRKALIDLKREMFFGQLADTLAMPKHYGRAVKQYHYIPLLDDRNINDQGIDATGASITDEVTITITDPSGMSRYAVGNGADAATALVAAQGKAQDIFLNMGMTGASYAANSATLTAAGWTVVEGTAVNSSGNLYGSSKDVGTIVGKLPTISETGGRVNRVGFTRLTIEGSIENFGFFDEYSVDSVQFDNDADLMQHISRETLRGANYLAEQMLQIDLLNGAGIVYYGGTATSTDTLTGNTGDTPSVLDYETLIRVENILNNNLCPRDTVIITGSRMIDTRTVGASRYVYIGSELKLNLLKMDDFHGFRAFIPVQQYAEAGTLASGEIGAIGNYRFIENPQMLHWDGAGATVTTNDGYMESDGKYNVYPALFVGSGSFTTIGFQTSGDNTKFQIINQKPGSTAANRLDPYGKTGFYSIQFWYGSLILRPEWIALVKCVAEK
jgi:N4-gp56 family major capsid protein